MVNKYTYTNETLLPEQLNTLIRKLENTIPNFPKLNGKTVSYDYEEDINVISLMWETEYYISEDCGNYILDLNKDREIIGIELLNFNINDLNN